MCSRVMSNHHFVLSSFDFWSPPWYKFNLLGSYHIVPHRCAYMARKSSVLLFTIDNVFRPTFLVLVYRIVATT